jgi:aryl-alcohol dehydrogenase-like predicted oxidoreductase
MSMTGVYDVDQRQDERSEATVRRALDLGITLLDTADSYGPFTNELLVGRAAGGRDDAILSTKVGLVGRSDGQLLHNGRPDHILAAADASLRRLQRDRIDLYTLHSLDPAVPVSETWDAMASLVAAGKVRALGVMTDDIRVVAFLQQRFPVTAVFTEYSLWNSASEPLVSWCGARSISVLATSPLGRGFLTGALSPARKFAWTDLRSRLPQFSAESLAAGRHTLDAVKAVARRHRATPGQVALTWLLQQGDHVIPLMGTKRPNHLEENARAADLHLDDVDLRQLAGEDVSDLRGQNS